MVDGVILLHKPVGMTSHDCVHKVRKILHTKKVGHTGTLDPDVSGVLPICVGKATKLVEFLIGENKTYEAEVTLGFSTTTEDASGEIVAKEKVGQVTREQIEKVFQLLTGEITQTPPMYSAIKINGKKLYEYARAGIEIERPSRKITIYTLELLDEGTEWSGDTVSFRFRVDCSKGTYIRTLAVQIGEFLGYPAHMSDLVRTKSGKYHLDECMNFSELENYTEQGIIQEKIIQMHEAISLPKYILDDTLAEKVRNGAVLPLDVEIEEPFVMEYNNDLLAIYMKHPTKNGLMKPMKVFR